ncbi:MAG: hypothetical protein C0402_13375 [Thermodesulfovibrio sp.]|nr:hypothetical protein [Thermodesulfovibrio sp.]
MKIYFSGIAGSGVSAIAGFMADRGNSVSGSDRLLDQEPGHFLRRLFAHKGILVVPQDGTGLDASFDLAVFSTAVEKDNPDLAAAARLNIPVKTRPEYLADIVSRFKTVAVAGTSGKSTTSGMLAFMMQRLGMAPNFIGGGRVKQFRTPETQANYLVGSSDLLVIEACESDGSIVNYRPAHAIIANLDLDHHSVAETARMFEQLAAHTSGLVVVGADDKNLARCSFENVVGFSVDRSSRYQAIAVSYERFSTSFRVNGQGFELNMPGRHNLYNALACIALLSEMGVDLAAIASALPVFTGIERRFDIHLNDGRHLVVDDYAHNPHKLESLMQTMQGLSGIGGSICYIFQPHGFGPTRMMKQGYIDVFTENLRAVDRLVLLPIYYAGGTAAKDISSEDIADAVRAAGRAADVLDRDAVMAALGDYESYVVLGARDDSLSDFAEKIAAALK